MTKLLQNIFSVKKDEVYKTWTILGLKIKYIRSKIDKNVAKFIKKYSLSQETSKTVSWIYNTLKTKYKKVNLIEYSKGNILLEFNNIKVFLDINAPLNFYEIFINNAINFAPYVDKNEKYNVIDIGANRGYTVINFAKEKWCNKVFAYECVPDTFKILSENINLNDNIKRKVQLNSYGLSNKDSDFEVYTIKGYDISASSNLELLKKTWPDQIDNIVSVKCFVKKSSNVIPDVLKNNSDYPYILKVDVEGSEYDIFKDLVHNSPEVFDKIETIFIETHLGYKEIDNYIDSLNKGFILDNLYVNGDNIHMLVYTKVTPKYWERKFDWTNFN